MTAPSTFAAAARGWLRTTAPVALRSTGASFAIGLLVAGLLVLVHGLDSRSQELVLGVPGLRVHTGLDERTYALPLFLAALAGWVLLTSASRLVVARQVRGYLRDLPANRARADGSAQPDHEADAMAERLLLETYLQVAASAARAVAMTVALFVVLPWPAVCGVVACWFVAVLVATRRFADGRQVSVALTSAAREVRVAPGATAHSRFVDAIYLRDARMHRLPLRQAVAILAATLLLVIVPGWALRPDSGAAAAGLVVLVWLQALLSAVTESGGVGWRAQLWFDQRYRRPEGGGDANRVGRADLAWWAAAEPGVTVVAVVGRGPASRQDLVPALAASSKELGAGLLVLTPQAARHLRPPLPGGAELGPVLVIDLAGRGSADRAAGLVDSSGGRVVRTVVVDPTPTDGHLVDVTPVGESSLRRLAAAGRVAEALRIWSDATIGVAEAGRLVADLVADSPEPAPSADLYEDQ